MNTKEMDKAQGHWILAKMGKRVLRPGGKELTQKLIAALDINPQDDMVEFAPGLGFTARLALAGNPHSYIGVDADPDVISLLTRQLKGDNVQFRLSNAANTGLESNSKDKVIGEAMLTMHADHRKSEIIKESHRILKKGGLYGIHELGLRDVDEHLKSEIQRELALTIKVNARPLTEVEWRELLEQEGFLIRKVFTNQMLLLETKRVVGDEGFFRSLKIGFNILKNGQARRRIVEMRNTFKKYRAHMNSIAIIAEKM